MRRFERRFWRVVENDWVRWGAWVLVGYLAIACALALAAQA